MKINITTKPSTPPSIYNKISAELNETKLNNTTKSKLIRPNKNEKIETVTDHKLNRLATKWYFLTNG